MRNTGQEFVAGEGAAIRVAIWIAIIGIAAFALVIALSPDKSLLMNGNLSGAHADIEADCSSCHVPWRQTQTDRCQDCHQVDLTMTTHELVPLVCADCHLEHRGREAQLWHEELGQCMDCHAKYIETTLHPGRGAECFSCHAQHLPQAEPVGAISDLIMSHESHLRAGGLVEAVCSDCHTPDPEGVNLTLPLFEQCSPCHFESPIHDTSQDIASGVGCVYCHSLERGRQITGDFSVVVSFRKVRSGVPNTRFSHADHLPFDCETCHNGIGQQTDLWEISLPEMDSCLNCH